MMKKGLLIILIGCLFVFPALANAQVGKVLEDILGGQERDIRAEDLRILELEFLPDPIQEGQRVVFRASVHSYARRPARVNLLVRDRDQIVSEVRGVVLSPGDNQVEFPGALYRFFRSDSCFMVEADIARKRAPIDALRQFCARRTPSGWTLSDRRAVELSVEDLAMYPDPAFPGQEVGFSVRLRNDGRPVRGDIRIQDGDQTVTRVENVAIPAGLMEYQFPRGRYTFQRFDTCFTVVVDVDRTPYSVDAERQFCVKPTGWSLQPGPRDRRGARGR
jgi:hypothetical protein